MRAVVEAIQDAQVDEVAAFMHAHLNTRVTPAAWAAAMRPQWMDTAPNRGFLLRAGAEVVGAYLAFYSQRVVDGEKVGVCNLAAWCVLPEHRLSSLRLFNELLAQPGYVFTDLSPSGAVVPLNLRMGFTPLDTTTALVPNLPWPTMPRRVRVHTDPATLRDRLSDDERVVYDDHAGPTAAQHVVLERAGRTCWVVYRRDRRKDLPLFASLLHVGDAEVFRDGFHVFSRHLLLRRAIPVLLLETRLAGRRPTLSWPLANPRPKMFRGAGPYARDVDYFYSELACVAW